MTHTDTKTKSMLIRYFVFFATALCIGLFGCGGDDNGPSSDSGNDDSSHQQNNDASVDSSAQGSTDASADTSAQGQMDAHIDSSQGNADASADALALNTDADSADSSTTTCQVGGNGPTTHDTDIEADETWRAEDNPHVVANCINVGGDESRVATLTIEPCVEVRFTAGSCLLIGEEFTRGALVAQGSADEPITFTSDQADGSKTPGYWDTIYFGRETAENTLLEHVIIEYGGRVGSGANAAPNWDDGQIIASGNSDTLPALTIRNTEIRHGSTNGIVLWAGARFSAQSQGLVISDNTKAPVVIEQDAVQTTPTDSDSKYNGNGTDGIVIDSGGVTSVTTGSPTWNDPGVPYINRGDIIVDGADLTIANGVTIASEAGIDFTVTTGTLSADNVTFTSWPTDSAHWGGIYFAEGGSGTLTNCVIERGGSGTQSGGGGYSEGFNINVDARTETDLPSITDCAIRDSVVDGISLWGIDVDTYNGDNTFSDNGNCDVVNYNPPDSTSPVCWNH
jgi:hypothetical protein